MSKISNNAERDAGSRKVKVEQAAAHVGLAKMTLNMDRCTGRLGIPYYKIGRSVVYDLDQLDVWLAQRARHSPANSR